MPRPAFDIRFTPITGVQAIVQTNLQVTADRVREAYAALASGDKTRIREYWADDMVWRVPGHNRLSGWYYGLDAFLAFMGQVGALSGQSFRMDSLAVLADGEYSADVTHNVGYRAGSIGTGEVPYTKLDIEVVHVLRWREGKVIAGKGAIFDDGTTQYDQFWSEAGVSHVPVPSSNGREPTPPTAAQPAASTPGVHPATAVVDRMYQCFAQGDMDTLKTEVFASDIEWALPGHHPLSGVKRGADEVIAFFGELMATGVHVDNISFGTIGDDTVVERHTGHGTVNNREFVFPTCSVYSVRDNKIARVQVYTADQHGVDDYFWQAYQLKPLPDRLTADNGRA